MELISSGFSILTNGVSRLDVEDNVLVDGVVVDDTGTKCDCGA